MPISPNKKIPTQTSQSAWGPQKKEPQKHNLCGLHLFILYILSYAIRTDAQGKIMAKLWHRQDAQGMFHHGVAKARKSTASPKYVVSCIFLSFIVNLCLLFGARCAIIITEDDSFAQ
jgi:hypothetical protein